LKFKQIKNLIQKNSSVKGLLFALGCFVFLLFGLGVVTKYFDEYNSREVTAKFKLQVESQLDYLLENAREISLMPDILNNLENNKEADILDILIKEKANRKIGAIAIVNKDGVVVSRTRTELSKGENVFLTSPQGRAVSAGIEIKSVELSSLNPTQLVITAATPIWLNNEMVGVVFATERLDNEFTSEFKSRFLGAGAEIAFYTNDYGISGSSFKNESERNLIQSYFSPRSEWINSARSGDTVSLNYSTAYKLVNLPFKGLEGNPGGALLFIRSEPSLVFSHSAILLSILLIFFAVIVAAHIRARNKHRQFIHHVKVSGCLIVLVLLAILTFWFFSVRLTHLVPPGYPIYNATLRLQPESGILDVDYSHKVSVILDTGAESVNALDVLIEFDPEIAQVDKFNTNNSLCNLFLNDLIDNQLGFIRLTCVIPSPGFKGESGLVGDIEFRAIKSGSIGFKFIPQTSVLANDGLGTEVLRQTTDATFHLKNYDFDSSGLANIGNDYTVSIFSPTHPNSNRWYNTKKIDLVWDALPGYTYFYGLDKNHETIPDGTNKTKINKTSFQLDEEGSYYFHLQPVLNGKKLPIAHWQFNIDLTPPSNVRLRASENVVDMGSTVRFEFSGEDNLSGLNRSNYVEIGSDILLPVGQSVYVPFLDAGKKSVKLRVYDNAGNFTDAVVEILVKGSVVKDWVKQIFISH